MFKKIFTFLSLCMIWFELQSQNLVPNPSFETYTECPDTYGAPGLSLAPPWLAPTQGTPDYFHECATNWQFDAPTNYTGFQYPLTGVAYMGMLSYGDIREYLTAPLTQPLEAGTWYQVSFYVNLANVSCGTNKMGAFLSPFQPFSNSFQTLPHVPQVESQQGIMNDTVNWELVTGCFQAEGGEAYITIGNFRIDNFTSVDPDCNYDVTYYLIEDVSVVVGSAPEEIDFDLGDPVEACFSYIIDPDISGYNMLWEDGTTGPTLEVSETGTYSLTITDGCNYGIDSIDVTILSTLEPLDIGPPEIIICDGGTYTVSLDPSLGEYEWQDGSDDTEYVITSPGTYSVTLDDGCSSVSDEIEVETLLSPPPFGLGDDQILCIGDELEIELDPDLGDFTWQDNTTNASYNISTGGTYSLTISNMCGEESDEITITPLDIPDVQLGPDLQTMCDLDVLELELDPDLGDIQWPDGSDDATFTVTEPGSYIAFVTNECGTGSDMVNVSLLESPQFNFGPDTTLCANETLLLSVLNINGAYEWQNQSTNDSFNVSASGLYTLSITNACGEDADSILVTYVSVIVPPAFGPDVNLCPGEQLTLYANNPGENILWQDLSTEDSLLVTTSGIYHVMVSNACQQAADTIVVTVNDNPPQLDLPGQLTLCLGQTVTLDAVITNVNYLWNDNSTNQTLSINSPGTFSLTVSNACGVDADTAIILDGGLAPFVTLGPDLDICPGATITLTPSNSNVTSWLWQDGSINANYVVSSAGLVTVEVSNSCGNSFDTLMVSLLPATPPLDLGPDTSICPGESVTLTIQTPDVSILWPDGSSSPVYTVSNPGDVVAIINNACGQSTDTINIDLLPDVPDLNLGPDQSLCPGELIVLEPNVPGVNYLWNDGSTNSTYQTTQEETIILSISNECGVSTDTLEVIESTQGPQVDLGADIQECAGETVTILSGISGVDYVWQDGSTDPEFTTTQSGEFILQVSNNCGSDSDTILVDISGVAPTPDLGPDTVLCDGITFQLISNADSETSIEWQDGSNAQVFTVNSAGTFILNESNRCGDAADTVVINYLSGPLPFSLGPDTTLCPGETIILVSPSTIYSIQWQDGSDQLNYTVTSANTYSLSLSNTCGTVSDAIQVEFDNRIPQLNIPPTIEWCEGDNITLDATQSFPAAYLWNTGAVSPVLEVSETGLFTIDVTTHCQSISQDVDVIEGSDCVVPVYHRGIYIPNVFSPNGDGYNDVFTISLGSDLQAISIKGTIYDRWGNMLYYAEGNPFIWDGYFNDEAVLPGVFVYSIVVEYMVDGKIREESLAGDVTLLR